MKIQTDITLYTAGENGYCHNRIPGIVRLPDGTLLTYWECRRGRNDWSVSEIGMKKSTDGGATWSAERYIASGEGKNTVNNPVMAVFPEGEIVFLWLENYKRLFMKKSTDAGETWTPKREISDFLEGFRPVYPWTVAATGPGHALVTDTGRILVPMWLTSNPENVFAHHPSVTATLYSDDRGETWHCGEILPTAAGTVDSQPISDPNESALAQTSRGIHINTRHTSPTRRRLTAISPNGIGAWTNLHYDENLLDPICAGGMCSEDDVLYVCHCDSESARENVTLSRSADFGASWDHILLNTSGGYSDVCVGDGKAWVVYETERETYIRLAIVEL